MDINSLENQLSGSLSHRSITILGSTGSVGCNTVELIQNNQKHFSVESLTANQNVDLLAKQARILKPKTVALADQNGYDDLKKSLAGTSIKVTAGKNALIEAAEQPADIVMSSIVGAAGLKPTLAAVKRGAAIGLANKECLVSAGDVFIREVKKSDSILLPVDSEHFSIMELTKNLKDSDVKEIIITASGGPFLKKSLNRLNKVKPKEAANHPNWKMGKKISIDSANMMNKFFEIIEACKLFKFNKNKYKILIHPQSYVHSIVRFKNGLIKMILYNTDMKIPISNTIYQKNNSFSNKSKIDSKILNKLSFEKVNLKKFPSIKLIKKCFKMGYSTPIIINASNEVLVSMFLKQKINFLDIVKTINKILKDKEFNKYAKKKPKTVKDVKLIDKWARLKTTNMCVI